MPSAECRVRALAQSLAVAAAAQNVEAMRGPGGIHGFGFSALRGKFECNSRDRHGLTATRTCIFKDAPGNAQPAFDELTTASVALHLEIRGGFGRDKRGRPGKGDHHP